MEINHPESLENIEQPYLQFNLQVAKSGSNYKEEDIHRYFDLQLKHQQEVFIYSFIDLFVDYMESLSSLNVRLFLSNEGWLFPSFEMNFDIPWAPLFIISRLEVLPVSQIFVWLHWKHDFT